MDRDEVKRIERQLLHLNEVEAAANKLTCSEPLLRLVRAQRATLNDRLAQLRFSCAPTPDHCPRCERVGCVCGSLLVRL